LTNREMLIENLHFRLVSRQWLFWQTDIEATKPLL